MTQNPPASTPPPAPYFRFRVDDKFRGAIRSDLIHHFTERFQGQNRQTVIHLRNDSNQTLPALVSDESLGVLVDRLETTMGIEVKVPDMPEEQVISQEVILADGTWDVMRVGKLVNRRIPVAEARVNFGLPTEVKEEKVAEPTVDRTAANPVEPVEFVEPVVDVDHPVTSPEPEPFVEPVEPVEPTVIPAAESYSSTQAIEAAPTPVKTEPLGFPDDLDDDALELATRP